MENKSNNEITNQKETDSNHNDKKKQTQTINNSQQKNKTYFSHECEDGTKIEVDLVTFREKGEEVRYLQFKTTVIGQDQQVDIDVNINDEKKFKELKEFFNNLNWKD